MGTPARQQAGAGRRRRPAAPQTGTGLIRAGIPTNSSISLTNLAVLPGQFGGGTFPRGMPRWLIALSLRLLDEASASIQRAKRSRRHGRDWTRGEMDTAWLLGAEAPLDITLIAAVLGTTPDCCARIARRGWEEAPCIRA